MFVNEPEISSQPPSSSIADGAKKALSIDIQQPKKARRKKPSSKKFAATSIVLCFVLLATSIINSEIRATILYPAIAYLIFQVIEKAIAEFDSSRHK